MSSRVVSLLALGLVVLVGVVLTTIVLAGRGDKEIAVPAPEAFTPTLSGELLDPPQDDFKTEPTPRDYVAPGGGPPPPSIDNPPPRAAEPEASAPQVSAPDQAEAPPPADNAEPQEAAGEVSADNQARHEVANRDQETFFTALQNEQPAAGQLPPWPDLEKRFEILRRGRSTPEDALALHSAYTYLASPQSTGSRGYPQHCAKLAEWRQKVPKSTTALVCLAAAHIDWAWEARGGGWAHTVTEEGWQQFHTRIGEARKLLEEAVKRGVDDGEAYCRLQVVAMAESLPEAQTKAWFNAGYKLDPLYVPLYIQRAQGLMPRWGGEPGDVEKFANAIPRAVKGDDGLEIMAWVALHIHRFEPVDPVTLFWGQYDHKLLMQAAEVLAKRYPTDQSIVQFAALCSLATQDLAAAKRLRPQVGPFNNDDRVWVWPGVHDHFLKWAESEEETTPPDHWVWGTHFRTGQIAFAPNSRFVWSLQGLGSKPVALFDLETRSERMALPGPVGASPRRFAFDKNKKWVLAGFEGKKFQGWILWDIATKTPVPRPTEKHVSAVAINPARPQVAWAERKTVQFFDIEEGKAGATIELKYECGRIWFSPDGKCVVIGATTYDVETGEKKVELPQAGMQPQPKIMCNSVLAIDEDGSLWCTADTGFTKAPPPRPIVSLLKFAPDGKTWTTELPTLSRDVEAVYSPSALAISPDRKWLVVTEPHILDDGKTVGSGSKQLQIWHVPSGKPVKALRLYPRSFGDIVFSDDSKRLAILPSQGPAILAWDLEKIDVGQTQLASQEE